MFYYRKSDHVYESPVQSDTGGEHFLSSIFQFRYWEMIPTIILFSLIHCLIDNLRLYYITTDNTDN